MKEAFVVPNLETLLSSIDASKKKVVIVSVIGKTAFMAFGLKLKILGRMFVPDLHRRGQQGLIEGYFDEENLVIYLHVYSLLDSDSLVQNYKDLVDRCKAEKNCDNFLAIYDEVKSNFAKNFLLVLHISHIIVLSHPGSTFDINYIQYFKAASILSQKLEGKINDSLCKINGISDDWLSNGRPCVPRLLFYFERAPTGIKNIKKMEHTLEDKIYHVLKKMRIINSQGSLFAIPLNQEFVYISTDSWTGRLQDSLDGLIKDCQPGTRFLSPPPFSTDLEGERSFHKFLNVHIKEAKNKGFNDTPSNRHVTFTPIPFELPSLENWCTVTSTLHEIIFSKKQATCLCTDTRFSEQRCLKVLPLAIAQYQEGLLPHYGSAEHEGRLAMARALFRAQARGPAFKKYETQLKNECRNYWENGRQQCEVLSLCGNPCKLAKHGSDQEHISGYIFKAVCDCGRKVGSREDPYDHKEANFTFYHDLNKECQCHKFDRVKFPIFEPSTTQFTEATLPILEEPLSNASDPLNTPENASGGPHGGLTTQGGAEKGPLGKQISTTEYLPGMLTHNSPVGLLPKFESWALVCLGPSSLYSHNLGLSDNYHPGFLSGTNYLLPWDVIVYSKGKGWPSITSKHSTRGRRRPAGSHPQFSVKVFIGTEYECPSGHRFMLSAPDKVLKAQPGSIVKETGHKIAESDMPLFFPCACRSSKVAQLMRLHVVTPKAPVNCTLHPRIQPASGAPLFVPTREGPTKLTQSSYWIMRLPYVYYTDKENYSKTNYTGRMVSNVFGVTEVE